MKTVRFVNNTDTITFTVDGTATTIQGAAVSIAPFSTSEYSPRINPQSRYGKSGGIATGDREVGPRSIPLIMHVTVEEGNGDLAYINCMSYVLGFFRTAKQPVFLYDDQDDILNGIPRRTQVELTKEDLKPVGGQGSQALIMEGLFELSMTEAFWEDAEEITYISPTGGIATLDSFVLTNDSQFDVYPVFRITPADSNSLFRLTNTTTDVWIEIGSNDFTVGTELEISSVDGSITIDGVNISATALSEGSSFPFLRPGANTFTYTSAFGDIYLDVGWRRRFPR